MSGLQVYIPPLFLAAPMQLLQPYHFFAAAIVAVLAIIVLNRCVLDRSICALDESVWSVHDQQNKLGKVVDEQSDALKNSLAALEARVLAAEKAFQELRRRALHEESKMTFVNKIACTTYLQCHKPHITYLDEQVLKCLEKSPTRTDKILKYITENKSLIHRNFFNSGGELTLETVEICLYHLQQQGRVAHDKRIVGWGRIADGEALDEHVLGPHQYLWSIYSLWSIK